MRLEELYYTKSGASPRGRQDAHRAAGESPQRQTGLSGFRHR